MKKLYWLLATLMILSLVLTACGAPAPEAPPEPAEPAAEEPAAEEPPKSLLLKSPVKPKAQLPLLKVDGALARTLSSSQVVHRVEVSRPLSTMVLYRLLPTPARMWNTSGPIGMQRRW